MKSAVRSLGGKRKNPNRVPVIFLLVCTVPSLLLTLYFTVYPAIRAFLLSFTDSTMLSMNRVNFIGLENYFYMFSDQRFLQALGNTAKLLLVVPVFSLSISLILAFTIVQCNLKEKSLYRTLFFFPSILSLTVDGIIWAFVFHPTMGILNGFLKQIGLESLARPWTGDASTALWCIAITLVWQAAGYYMVMHIAAMDGISAEIYEAATIDGAGSVAKFFHITLPLIKNIIGITYVLSLSGTLSLSYILVRVMTGGGPNGASSVVLEYIYNMGMKNGSFGYAMALTVVTSIFTIGLSVISQVLTNKKSEGEEA
ncbi:carbohydrate ABC transporter permease [Neglectibacter caecimuris]|uniref:carbohydrate ABC transporter permease n=1 Tax=Neglectibacter caecimuris TaxID=3093658 RepID=UPI002AC8F71C|nr:sugar ABC transporter permease [Neglectibacter sp. M00184]